MTTTEAAIEQHSHTLNVPAIEGKMGTTQYFTANFPLGMVVRLFTFEPERMSQLPVEQRTQRQLKKSRIPEIAMYLQEDDYFFSSLTVSVDAAWLEFVPSELDEHVGVLKLPMDTEWIINDGQHRVAGIAEAVNADPTLRNDNISVIVVADSGLERSQQIFSDLNRTVLKTSRSLDILFDHRSPVNQIATKVISDVPLFQGKVDKERVSLSAQSQFFATLSGIQMACVALLEGIDARELTANIDKYTATVVEFWNYATTLIEPWDAIAKRTLSATEARQVYVSSYQMMLSAVGAVGGQVLRDSGDWQKVLAPLGKVDWKKTNPDFQGLVLVGEEVVTRVTTRRALADYLRWKVGINTERPKPPLNVGQPKKEPAKKQAAAPSNVTPLGKRRGRPPKIKDEVVETPPAPPAPPLQQVPAPPTETPQA